MTEAVIYSHKRDDKMEITNNIVPWLHYLATVMWYGIVLLSKHFVTLIMILIVAWVSFVLSTKLAPFAPKPDTILILVKTNLSLGILVLLLTAILRGV